MQAKDRSQPPAPDLVKRGFRVNAPNRIWVGDMTCIRAREGWLHLAIVLDLFARRIVGWATATTQVVALPTAAMRMAIVQRNLRAASSSTAIKAAHIAPLSIANCSPNMVCSLV